MTHIPGRVRLGVVILLLLASPANMPAARARGAPSMAQALPLPKPGALLVLDVQQAQEVAVLMAFLNTYNAGRVGPALSLVTRQAGWSDCDYCRGSVIMGRDKTSFTTWLHQRVADHDHLTIARIEVGANDENALGVTFQRRTSDTLRALGHPHGIVPELSAKVLFDTPAGGTSSPLISAFANGPSGGAPGLCRV